MIKIVIWSKDLESGKKELEKVVKDYQRIGVEIQKERHSKYESVIEFKNGHYIRLVPSTESRRGIKCNISIVDRSIEQEFFDCIIRACTIIPPIQAFRFFGEGELIL